MDNQLPIRRTMIRCEICGTDSCEGVEVVMSGRTHRFHNFRCAIKALAPRCEHCQRGIVGRGPAASGSTFCCDRCAGDPRNRVVAGIKPAFPETPHRTMHPPDHLPALSARKARAQTTSFVIAATQPVQTSP